MKIGIIGAGLSGLTCGWYLKKYSNHDITIFESSGFAGGKLRTESIDGFQMDLGFQVFLPAYPEAKRILDYEKLQLQWFHKGSLIYRGNKKMPFYDPENGLIALLQTAFYGPGSLIDKLRLLKFKWIIDQLSVEDIFNGKRTISSLDYLREFGFSQKMIQDFWIPFYQGVFLENSLDTDSRMLQFTFKMFADGGATVPRDGMNAIPKQLVDYLGADIIRFNTKVVHYDSKSISTSDQKIEFFDKVVVACDLNEHTKYNGVTNMYFTAEKLPVQTKHVILNANRNRSVNNVVMIGNVAPSYSRFGKHLISVSANGVNIGEDVFLGDLKSIFGQQVNDWKLVKSYTVKQALPVVDFNQKFQAEPREGVYFCGDYLIQGSINGAMESGRKIAEEIIKSHNKNFSDG